MIFYRSTILLLNNGGNDMRINKIDHIGIRVANFERSIRFYEQLGFAVTREDYNERVVELTHPAFITLNLLDSARHDHNRQNVLMDIEKQYPGYTHFALNVESIEEAVQFMTSHAIKITEGPVTFGNGKTSLFIRDPDLNVIEFTQDPL